jgi:hypothetical protein
VAAESAQFAGENALVAAVQAQRSASLVADTLSSLGLALNKASGGGGGEEEDAKNKTKEEEDEDEDSDHHRGSLSLKFLLRQKDNNSHESREARRAAKKEREIARRAKKRRRRLLSMQKPYVLLDGYKHPFQYDEVRISRQREGGLKDDESYGIVANWSRPLDTVMFPEFPLTPNGYTVYTNEKFIYNRTAVVKYSPMGHGGKIYTVKFYDLSNGRGWLCDFNNERPYLKQCGPLDDASTTASALQSTTTAFQMKKESSGMSALFNGNFTAFYGNVVDNLSGKATKQRLIKDKNDKMNGDYKDTIESDLESIEKAAIKEDEKHDKKNKFGRISATTVLKLKREEAKKRQNASLKMLSQEKEKLKKSKNQYLEKTVRSSFTSSSSADHDNDRRDSSLVTTLGIFGGSGSDRPEENEDRSSSSGKEKKRPSYLGRLNAIKKK